LSKNTTDNNINEIIIRTDASSSIGIGHVMRCLTLAEELKRHNVNISFICREEVGHLNELIEQRGFRVHTLPANLDFVSDRVLTQEIIESQFKLPEWLVADHYGIDIAWESSFRDQVKKIMVIDDLADRNHDCDVLLDQNYSINENRYEKLVPGHCIQLLGPKYALLRLQFLEAREKSGKREDEVSKLFVFMGGADTDNVTCKVLKAIQILNRSDIATDVVVGVSNPYRDEVEKLASMIPNTRCYFQVEDMVSLMATADLSIGGSGTTTWERCCVGLPSIVISIAENQIGIADNLEKKGVIINLGWHEKVKINNIKFALENLLERPDIRKQMRLKSLELVDAYGTNRVARELIKD
jgi:UDP-2,4-diacetamido-2,4,6-trideoxy-beta-L-altropyranose hydrolase